MVNSPNQSSTPPRFYDGDCLDEAMLRVGAIRELIDRVGEAFAALASGGCHHPPRTMIPGDLGSTLLMGASIAGIGRTAKVVSVFPGNLDRGQPSTLGLLLALCPETGRVMASMDAARLTAWRTGAASGLATELLARPDAKRLALVGAGAQALTQAHAVCAVRPIDEICVYARDRVRLETFCQQACDSLHLSVRPAASADDAVAGADVVCAATTSSLPVFDGRRLAKGTHLNGVGSFRLAMREVDRHTIERAWIVVDQRESALSEAGELVDGCQAGLTKPEDWTEIGTLIGRGPQAIPSRGDKDLTFFKSVGHAAQDVAAAAYFLSALDESYT